MGRCLSAMPTCLDVLSRDLELSIHETRTLGTRLDIEGLLFRELLSGKKELTSTEETCDVPVAGAVSVRYLLYGGVDGVGPPFCFV